MESEGLGNQTGEDAWVGTNPGGVEKFKRFVHISLIYSQTKVHIVGDEQFSTIIPERKTTSLGN